MSGITQVINGYRHYHSYRSCTTPTYGKDGSAHHWPDEISYNWNSLGFRSNELQKDKKSIATFGCSFTTGVGIPQHQRFGDVVAREHDMDHYCFGTPAADNMTIFHNFLHFAEHDIKNLDLQYVLILWTFKGRFTWHNNGNLDTEYSMDVQPETWQRKFLIDWDANVATCYLETMMRSVDQICKLKNIPVIQTIVEPIILPSDVNSFFQYPHFNKNNSILVDKARDNSHPGKMTHSKLAKFYCDIISNINKL